MEVEDYFPITPSTDDPNYNSIISSELQFAILGYEGMTGSLYNYQELVRRYMHPMYGRTGIILNDDVGTGKTRTALGAVDPYIQHGFGKPVIITGSDAILETFKTEIPAFYQSLGRKDIRASTRFINKEFEMTTFRKFVNDLSRMTNEQIIETYNKRPFIFDEMHQIRYDKDYQTKNGQEDRKKTEPLYTALLRFLDLLPEKVVFVLTATLMVNDISDLPSTVNFALPPDRRLSIADMNAILKGRGRSNKLSDMSDETLGSLFEYLEGRLRGYLSRVSARKDKLRRDNQGDMILDLLHPLVLHDMNPEQFLQYYNSTARGEGQHGAFDIRERNTNSFTYPTEIRVVKRLNRGENPDSVKLDTDEMIEVDEQGRTVIAKTIEHNYKTFFQRPVYYIDRSGQRRSRLGYDTATYDGFLPDINDDVRHFLSPDELPIYSRKYSDLIRVMKENRNKPSYIYTPLVKGGGAHILTHAFISHGYEFFSGVMNKAEFNIRTMTKRPRIAILTTEVAQKRKPLNLIMSLFNHPMNVNGEYLQAIIGTQASGTGINLINAQMMHTLSPEWNIASLSQAEGRVFRSSSLLHLPPQDRMISVYRHASVYRGTREDLIALVGDADQELVDEINKIPLPYLETTDVNMYRHAEGKQDNIDVIQTMLNSIAMDCAINNYRDPSTRCMDQGLSLQTGTFNAYYLSDIYDDLMQRVRQMFVVQDSISLEYLITQVGMPRSTLRMALRQMIEQDIIIRDRFGFPMFLREANGVYYLQHERVVGVEKSDYFSIAYSSTLTIPQTNTLTEYLLSRHTQHAIQVLSELENLDHDEALRQYLSLEPDIKALILEHAILNESRFGTVITSITNNLWYVIEEENCVIHVMLAISPNYDTISSDNYRRIRRVCMNERNPTWQFIPADDAVRYIDAVHERLSGVVEDLKSRFPVYGVLRTAKQVFVIRLSNARDGAKGQICENISSKDEALEYIRLIGNDTLVRSVASMSMRELCNVIQNQLIQQGAVMYR